jgi:hypothetical protein
VCGNCQRHGDTCVYEHVRHGHLASQRPEPSSSDASSAVDVIDDARFELSESKSRRIRELKLLHHYNIFTAREILTSGDEIGEEAWIKAVPRQAFSNDALLFTMFALSALHMTEFEPDEEDIIQIHRRYLAMALAEHKKDVLDLNQTNFDAVLLTSSLLRITLFAMLRERPLTPYAPPIQWLEMTRGAMNLFRESWKWVEKDETSMAFRLTQRMPIVWDEEGKFAASNREGLEHLLHRDEEDIANEPWPPDVMEAYETTVSYIGCILIAMKDKAMLGEVRRRLVIFPYIVRSKYIELVKDRKPRALTVLAYYFALVAQFGSSVWWIGGSGVREVRALEGALQGKWHEHMAWPLQQVSEQSPPPLTQP